MISPTVGRIVWFWKFGEPKENEPTTSPEAAIVTYVHSDTMLNLSVFDHNGVQRPETSVYLLQDGNERTSQYYATWMPYQKGQAAKTEAVEKQLAAT